MKHSAGHPAALFITATACIGYSVYRVMVLHDRSWPILVLLFFGMLIAIAALETK
jgi:hypothetical protein